MDLDKKSTAEAMDYIYYVKADYSFHQFLR